MIFNYIYIFLFQIQEIQELEKQLCESHNKLSMTEMQVQHLSSSDSSHENSSQLEEVYHQKLELEKKLSLVCIFFFHTPALFCSIYIFFMHHM